MQLALHGGFSVQSEPLLAGDDGTAQTIARIRALVEQGKKDPRVNHATGKLLRIAGVKPHDRMGEIRAIFFGVLHNIRFTQDPEGTETLRPAATTLEWGFGDCDDINAILLPSMLKTIGFNVRLVTIAAHPGDPKQFSHVYCEVYLRGRWIPLDAARPDTKFGVAPPKSFRHRVWSLEDPSYQDLQGLGCGACDGGCAGCAMKRRTLGTHFRLSGMRKRGLGFDWGDFSDVIDSAGKAATGIISAARAPAGVVYPSYGAYPPPPGYGAPGGGGGVTAIGSISQNTLIIGGLALVGVLLLTRRGGG